MAPTTYSPVEKEDDIEYSNYHTGSSDSLLSQARGFSLDRGLQSLRTYLPWLIHGVLLFCSAAMLFLTATYKHVAKSKHSAFSPALASLDAYQSIRFNGTFDAPSPYRARRARNLMLPRPAL